MQLSIDEKLACLYECVYRIGNIDSALFQCAEFGICAIMEDAIGDMLIEKNIDIEKLFHSEWLIDDVFPNFHTYRPAHVFLNSYWYPTDNTGMSDRILVLLAMADELEDQKLITK